MTNHNKLNVAVVQDGARLHYAVPLALQNCNILSRVFVGWYASPWTVPWLVSKTAKIIKPEIGQRMLDRYCPSLDHSLICTNTFLALQRTWSRHRFQSGEYFHQWESSRMANWIKQIGLGNSNVIYGFVRNIHPDLLYFAKSKGLATITDQMIAPAHIEQQEARIQVERFPAFRNNREPAADTLTPELEAQSWSQSDHITCASSYVRDGLLSMGVAPSKISVVPYPVDANYFTYYERTGHKGPMVVGFVGSINLRKGLPYFLEVAKHFDPALVRFVMVGPVQMDREELERVRGHVEIIGAVPRSEISSWLARFDVYFFPSTCEGSAGSIMEAMATGLPIITTPNSGSIVQDQCDGFINGYADIAAHIKAIMILENTDLRIEMGKNARQSAERANIKNYGLQLARILHAQMAMS